MRTPTITCLTALALLVLAAPAVQADQISYSYSFSQSSDTVYSNAASVSHGQIIFMPFSGTVTGNDPSSATITAVNLEAFSTASPKVPDQFHNAEYTLTMHIKDISSGLTAAVTFEGLLNGTISASGTNLTNTFLGQKEFTFDLNHHIYDISIGDFVAPGAPGSGDLGSISVDVKIHHNPEPSTLLLAIVGVPAAGWVLRRRL